MHNYYVIYYPYTTSLFIHTKFVHKKMVTKNINPFAPNGYLGGMAGQFGWKYVIFVATIYGFNQAVGYTLGNFAKDFWFSDPKPEGLDISPADSTAVSNFGQIPWQIKALYGMASDAFAIHGWSH